MLSNVFSQAVDEDEMPGDAGAGESVADSRARGSTGGPSTALSRGGPSRATGSVAWAGSAAASSHAPGSVAGSRVSRGDSSAASSSHIGSTSPSSEESLSDWPVRPEIVHVLALIRCYMGLAKCAEHADGHCGAVL